MSDIWGYVALGAFGLLAAFAEWFQNREAQTAGAQLQAASSSAATAAAETAIANAEALAPATQQGVFDRLKAGTF